MSHFTDPISLLTWLCNSVRIPTANMKKIKTEFAADITPSVNNLLPFILKQAHIA